MNTEGYNDRTAETAVGNTMREQKKKMMNARRRYRNINHREPTDREIIEMQEDEIQYYRNKIKTLERYLYKRGDRK